MLIFKWLSLFLCKPHKKRGVFFCPKLSFFLDFRGNKWYSIKRNISKIYHKWKRFVNKCLLVSVCKQKPNRYGIYISIHMGLWNDITEGLNNVGKAGKARYNSSCRFGGKRTFFWGRLSVRLKNFSLLIIEWGISYIFWKRGFPVKK